MIISFYDKAFKGLSDNAALVVDNPSYSLVRRGVDFDSLSCKCEAFSEDIQPVFLVVKNDKGNYLYGCLAGIPQMKGDNQTEIVGADLKTMLNSDIVFNESLNYGNVNSFLSAVFSAWRTQVNQGTFPVRLVFADNVSVIAFDEYLFPSAEKVAVFSAWTDLIAPYLKYYGLFMTSEIDLVNKAVIFKIGKAMHRQKNVKLWELGIRNYGKRIADINETQCYVYNTATASVAAEGHRWILTSDNKITTSTALRDVYPIKRKIVWKEASAASEVASLVAAGNEEALELLVENMFGENIDVPCVDADFETRFDIYPRRGEGLYKSLPCGELHYDASGLIKAQAGYRFTGIEFIL